jgi:hybrid cluster-associated redox disulfide protein
MTITKDMKIADVLQKYQAANIVLKKYLPCCLSCGGASAETIEQGARMHGVDPELLVEELNRLSKRPRKSDG